MKIPLLAWISGLATLIASPGVALPTAVKTLPTAVKTLPLQQQIADAEPNDTKETATPAVDLLPGDQFFLQTNFGGYDPDVFRVRPAALPMGIYRHTLTDVPTFSPTRVRALGLDAIQDEVLTQSFAPLSDSLDSGHAETPTLAWYGFGKSEEVYAELATTNFARSGAAAIVEFDTEPVTPVDLGVIDPWVGEFRIDAFTSADVPDTEAFLFDAEFNLLPYGWGDDNSGFLSAASIATTLDSGRYYLAVSHKGLASHQPPRTTAGFFHNEFALPATVTDFKGPLIAGSPLPGGDSFVSIRGNFSLPTLTGMLTIPGPRSAAWATFEVAGPQETFSFCSGNGSSIPCPCGNDAPAGSRSGCLHSEGRGGSIITTRLPSGRVELHLEGLPAGAGALTFVSMGSGSPVIAGGGLYCLSAPATRLPVLNADAAGFGRLTEELVGTNGFLSGMTVFAQSAYRDPNADAGCQINLTSGIAFRL